MQALIKLDPCVGIWLHRYLRRSGSVNIIADQSCTPFSPWVFHPHWFSTCQVARHVLSPIQRGSPLKKTRRQRLAVNCSFNWDIATLQNFYSFFQNTRCTGGYLLSSRASWHTRTPTIYTTVIWGVYPVDIYLLDEVLVEGSMSTESPAKFSSTLNALLNRSM